VSLSDNVWQQTYAPISLRIIGEIGKVTIKHDIQGKLENRGLIRIFVGYSFDHTNDIYWMLNLNFKRIIPTIYVVWIGKCYNNWHKNKAPSNHNDNDQDIEDSMEEYVTMNTRESSIGKDQVTQKENQKIKNKVYHELK
jgi:hypothetical protein